MIISKEFEIFSGTGGVGKTTLATSRAIHLAQTGKKVLLITIDPAKRLKELMGIKDSEAGDIIQIQDPLQVGESLPLFIELMDPAKTFARIATACGCDEVLNNRLLNILTRPHGGLNEILSIVELDLQYKSKKYDCIVLDTPPGSHFLDFLDGIKKIKIFFDQSFMEIFNHFGKKVDQVKVKRGLMRKIVSSGVNKLMSYLSKVTGDQFIDEFIDSILAVYKTKSAFIAALELQEVMKSQEHSNWYLVTSVEQNKLKEALELKNSASGLITEKTTVVLNKCLESNLDSWDTDEGSLEQSLKDSLLQRELELKKNLKIYFKNIIDFPEVINISPLEHIKKLSTVWKNTQEI